MRFCTNAACSVSAHSRLGKADTVDVVSTVQPSASTLHVKALSFATCHIHNCLIGRNCTFDLGLAAPDFFASGDACSTCTLLDAGSCCTQLLEDEDAGLGSAGLSPLPHGTSGFGESQVS